jgi:thiamine pyrophosphate-dependent acetolactate synthase large subunit-like protein
MADAFARMSGTVAVLSVHQGCGLTNAMTGIAEAAKSRTPLLVLAGEATEPLSNFAVDQPALAQAVGALSTRITSPATCIAETVHAYGLARNTRSTVLLNLPLDVQALDVPDEVWAEVMSPRPLLAPDPPGPPQPTSRDVEALADLLAGARRPVVLAGRGARHAGTELDHLATACGALLITSAVAKGLFSASPWSLDVCGGFATPLAAELVRDADVLVAFGCSLTMWTTRHGRLIGEDTTVAQVDDDAAAIGRRAPVSLGVVGDSAATARAVTGLLLGRDGAQEGYRDDDLLRRIAAVGRWRDVPYDDWSGGRGDAARIDPRTLTVLLDDALPAERVVAVDSGNFMGYPSMFWSVPDEQGFCFTQSFQSIGLGLATALGAGLAQPGRLAVAALGDGGALMAAAELDTVRRSQVPMVVVVYNDSAYGAEVHHFTEGEPLDTVVFPQTDIAGIAAGYGFDTVTVRQAGDVQGVRDWVAGRRERPLLVDAKVAAERGSWWLEEAFRGH